MPQCLVPQVYAATAINHSSRALSVVGFLVHQKPHNDAVYLEAYCVAPNFQRRKLGTALLRAFFRDMQGIWNVEAKVAPDNTGSCECLRVSSAMWNRGFDRKWEAQANVTYYMKELKDTK